MQLCFLKKKAVLKVAYFISIKIFSNAFVNTKCFLPQMQFFPLHVRTSLTQYSYFKKILTFQYNSLKIVLRKIIE